MAFLRYVLVISLATLSAGCDREGAVGVDVDAGTSVYSVLRTGSDTATVLLLRYQPGDGEAFQRLSGARVQIVSGSGVVGLPEAPEGFRDCARKPDPFLPVPAIQAGCYAARLPAEIRPGMSYGLRVELPGGDSITGAATVPSVPVVLSPAERAKVMVPAPGQIITSPSNGFTVRWVTREEAARVEVGIGGATAYRQDRRLMDVTCLVHGGSGAEDHAMVDSLRYSVLSAECRRGQEPVQWDSIALRVLVTVYDSAYARYARDVLPESSVRGGRASAGVRGAYGVFAGAASDERLVVLLPTR